jgi:hypothetical protein
MRFLEVHDLAGFKAMDVDLVLPSVVVGRVAVVTTAQKVSLISLGLGVLLSAVSFLRNAVAGLIANGREA